MKYLALKKGETKIITITTPMPKNKKGSKIKPYDETHQQGSLSIEQELPKGMKNCDFGIQIAKDGRIWICIDGIAYLRFKPEI